MLPFKRFLDLSDDAGAGRLHGLSTNIGMTYTRPQSTNAKTIMRTVQRCTSRSQAVYNYIECHAWGHGPLHHPGAIRRQVLVLCAKLKQRDR